MDAEKLKGLHINASEKRRSTGALWLLFLGVVAVTLVVASRAWPRKGEDRRLFTGTQRKPAAEQPAGVSVASGGTSAAPLPPGPAPGSGADRTNGSVLTVSGYIINRERIEISPRFLGQVRWMGVRKGDAVTNGQVLVLLEDSEQRARVKEAEGRLAVNRAALRKAEMDLARIEKLISDKIETQQAEDDARTQLQSALGGVKESEAALEVARTYLDWTVIRSPLNGVVLEKLADAGELVTPQSFGGTRGPSTALVAVADLDDLQVEIDLNEADLAKVRLGQNCRVTPEAYPDRSYAGIVAEIAPEANRQKGTLQVKVQVMKPDRFLTPELTAKVDFLAANPGPNGAR